MLINFLIGVAVLLVIFLLVASLQPADFKVVRCITVSAPAALPFNPINDVQKWQEMSPYVKYDTAAKMMFEGPTAGVGASFAWAGNTKVGEGRMTITDSRPNELIRFKLECFKPWTCTDTAEFSSRASGAQTEVTWTMFGQKNFMVKAMGFVVSMDKMIGRDFEAGLVTLKGLVEAAARN